MPIEARESLTFPAPVEDVRALGMILIVQFDRPGQKVAESIARLGSNPSYPEMKQEIIENLRGGFEQFNNHLVDFAQAESAVYISKAGGEDIFAIRSQAPLPPQLLPHPKDISPRVRSAFRHRVGSDLVLLSNAELLTMFTISSTDEREAIQAILEARVEMEKTLSTVLNPREKRFR